MIRKALILLALALPAFSQDLPGLMTLSFQSAQAGREDPEYQNGPQTA